MEDKTQNLELSGTVDRIVFRNDDNGYTVLELISEDQILTAVGVLPWINIGEDLKLIGRWKNHSSFGPQFQVDSCERFMPKGSQAVLKYLSSGAIKGIGEVTAKKLVDKFGDRTLDVIENHPDKLTVIKGITKAKANKICEGFKNLFGVREIMTYLSSFGVLPEEVVKIWKAFGSESIEIINQDPYEICKEPINISFEKADDIALKLNKPCDFASRIRTGILYVLKHNLYNGHTCLPKAKLGPLCVSFLSVNSELIEEQINAMVIDNTLVLDSINDEEFIFIAEMYECEKFCAGRLSLILEYPPSAIKGIESEIAKIEKQNGITYAQLQKEAIFSALKKGLVIMTGGPGTGKTTTLNAIISILESRGESVCLAAPTGRAAQRMSEVTKREAKTIHRLLGATWSKDNRCIFTKNERNLLDCDALILDELSMLDINVFTGLLRALPLRCRLILVGDCDQLPAVGPGNILKDMIDSGVVPVVRLSEIFRQSMKSLIVTNAHKIICGELPDIYKRDNDFFFLEDYSPLSISDTIVDLYFNRLPKAYGYSPLFDIQVLCPGRKGELGSIELNKKLQQAANPKANNKKEIIINGMALREGDKVMQIKNNYDISWERDDKTIGEGIFNGDVGILLNIDRRADLVKIRFDDKIAYYSMDDILDVELAYAITVHKSQGSEFETVIMPMYPGTKKLYYRNLLYTGVTRAKSMLIMVGIPKTVKIMVENNRKTKRYSALCHFLKECDQK